MLTIIEFIKS